MLLNNTQKLVMGAALSVALSTVALADHRGSAGHVSSGSHVSRPAPSGNHGGHVNTGGGNTGRVHTNPGPRNTGSGHVNNGGTRSGNNNGGRVTNGGRNTTSVQRGGRTYTQREYRNGSRTYVQRSHTTVINNRTVVVNRYYNRGYWGHHGYYAYRHYYWYPTWYWGFYFAPFYSPWYYTWDWYGAPWYAGYRWYYSPYRFYPAPSYWVTDYIIGRMLADEYNNGYRAGVAAASRTAAPITESDKEQLRGQVDATVKAFKENKSIELAEVVKDPKYLFVVDAQLKAVVSNSNEACALSAGDLLKVAEQPSTEAQTLTMSVVTSKGSSCTAGARVTVSVTDLQEMLNTTAQKVDDGMNELKKHKGEVKTTANP